MDGLQSTALGREQEKDLLSVIVRFHDIRQLEDFEQCIFSLSLQNIENIEIVVVVKGFNEAQLALTLATCTQQPWLYDPIFRILDCTAEDGVDTRALALQRGVDNISGRYVAFLDHDDVIYHDCYETLISLLQQSEAIVSFGRTRLAVKQSVDDNSYNVAKKKWFFWGDNRRDLWKGNFIVIHSYVIDRKRLQEDLSIDTSFSRLEDYALLLKLSVAGDFIKTENIVCEYRIPLGHELAEEAFGFPRISSGVQEAENQVWKMNTEKLSSLRESLKVTMSLEQFSSLMEDMEALTKKCARLQEQLEHAELVWSKHLEEAELLSFRLLRRGHAAVSKPGLLRETAKTVRSFKKFFKRQNK